MYPSSCNFILYFLVKDGMIFSNTQYSSVRVRKHKN